MDEGEVRRPRRGRIAAAALGGLLLLALAMLWSQRVPIARDFVDRELTARGVRARYDFTALGPRVQRLEHIVLGDPARPDLTADWAELRLTYGLGWPDVRSITAHGVRLHGRLVGGTVSFGSIDRLLPKPSGAPFALPDLTVDLSDARMRLETPSGPFGLALHGSGNLAHGFDGRLAMIGRRLSLGGCGVAETTAMLRVSVNERRPSLRGPLLIERLACPASRIQADHARIDLDGSFAETFAAWDAEAGLATDSLTQGGRRLAGVRGRLRFEGTLAATRGTLALAAEDAQGPEGRAKLGFDGRYAVSATRRAVGLGGTLRLDDLALAPATLQPLGRSLAALQGTPVGPLGAALAQAVTRAARKADIRAGVALAWRPQGGWARLVSLDAASASGAHAVLSGGEGFAAILPSGATRFDGTLILGGGGLPDARLTLRQAGPGAPLVGSAEIAPYAAGGARLALAPVRFGRARGGTAFSTTVSLDGPIGDGRVTGLSLPISGRLAGGGFSINPGCVPLDLAGLSVAGLTLGRTRLPLCPTGAALVSRSPRGVLAGGAQIARPQLVGRVGDSPLTLTAASLRAELGMPGFQVASLAVRLGAGAAVTRLDVTRLAGGADARGLGGRFEGAAGQIANVPLLLSEGAGGWRLDDGRLSLGGHLKLADAAGPPRFNPLVSDDVRLTLVDGVIRGSGRLREPTRAVGVTDVTLVHDLGTGRGNAVLDVPGLTFSQGFQPDLLTRLTVGVIANVAGTVSGRGQIAWNPQGVTSSGDFATESLGLAAAFGPVGGIRGRIHFDDLLALATPAGQTVTLGEVNPGIAVTVGTVRYRLLPEQKVAIEGGEWPFCGGRLILEPTVLDLAHPVERHLTFRVDGLDAALFLEQFKFENVAATGRFDGRLPIIFDDEGGRIEGGRLDVRQGGGTLAYVGQISNENLGTYGSMAFDALKAIRYQNLAIELNGRLDGEIVSRILFTGTNERPLEAPAPTGVARQFSGLPFKFNIVVRAPFRGLLNTASNFADPTQLIRNSAGRPAPGAGTGGVQPQESGDHP